jgi:hypothetical protein
MLALPKVTRALVTSTLPRSGSFERKLFLKKSIIHLGKEIPRNELAYGDNRHTPTVPAVSGAVSVDQPSR